MYTSLSWRSLKCLWRKTAAVLPYGLNIQYRQEISIDSLFSRFEAHFEVRNTFWKLLLKVIFVVNMFYCRVFLLCISLILLPGASTFLPSLGKLIFKKINTQALSIIRIILILFVDIHRYRIDAVVYFSRWNLISTRNREVTHQGKFIKN